MLKHLIVKPRSGLGNRLRLIVSSRRIARRANARLTVLWQWGDPLNFFEAEDDVSWVSSLPETGGITHLQTLRDSDGGHDLNRIVPISGPENILIEGCHLVVCDEDRKALENEDLKPWLLRPSQRTRAKAEEFRRGSFPASEIVGVHMRRGDHRKAAARAPDRLFIEEIRAAAEAGRSVFLATDSKATEREMIRIFGKRIIVYPKDPRYDERWAQRSIRDDAVLRLEDWIDFQILASCDFVLGTSGSSYSAFAACYNGSPRCRQLRLVDGV